MTREREAKLPASAQKLRAAAGTARAVFSVAPGALADALGAKLMKVT